MGINILNSEEFVVFTTRHYAHFADIAVPAASKQLKRLANKNSIIHLTRGIWANPSHPYFSPPSCAPVLLGSDQGYISFLTALHHYGFLSQIPATIQIATTGHSKKIKTPIGTYEFFQLKPTLFHTGIIWNESHVPYLMATPEKALLDTFYIATRKSKRFARLPELDLKANNFSTQKFKALLKKLALSKQIENAILKRLAEYI